MAVIAGAALTPSASAAETGQTAATSTTSSESATEELRLDPEQVRLTRERVAHILEQQPEGVALGGMSPQAAITSPRVVRHYGTDRYGTAAAVADAWWVDHFWNPVYGDVPFDKVVFVAAGHDFADALSGGAAAAAWGGPLLLTKKGELPTATKNVLNRLKPDVIMVLGGTNAVSATVEGSLREYANTVARFSGVDRYRVSAAVADHIGSSETAFIASGQNFPDGLAGGAAAGQVIAPLLITKPDDVPDPVMNVLRNTVLPRTIYVLGGPNAVNESVVTELKTIPGVTVRRISGLDRYEVAANVATLHPSTHGATVAVGGDFADALAGSAFAGLVGDKMLLVRTQTVPDPTAAAIHTHSLIEIDLLGGPNVVQDAVAQELSRIEVPAP